MSVHQIINKANCTHFCILFIYFLILKFVQKSYIYAFLFFKYFPQKMKILITGTPGAGKTTLSKEIHELYKIPYIEVSSYIIQNNLYKGKSKKFDSSLFDDNVVREHFKNYLKDKNSFIIDTHSPSVFDFINFDLSYVLKVSTDVLYTRLRQRGYKNSKIKENISCEIFEVIEDDLNGMKIPFYLVGDEEGYLTKDDVISQIGKNILNKHI